MRGCVGCGVRVCDALRVGVSVLGERMGAWARTGVSARAGVGVRVGAGEGVGLGARSCFYVFYFSIFGFFGWIFVF